MTDIIDSSGFHAGSVDDDGNVIDYSGFRAGRVSSGEVFDSDGFRVGYVADGDVISSSGFREGHIRGVDIHDSTGFRVGEICGRHVEEGGAALLLLLLPEISRSSNEELESTPAESAQAPQYVQVDSGNGRNAGSHSTNGQPHPPLHSDGARSRMTSSEKNAPALVTSPRAARSNAAPKSTLGRDLTIVVVGILIAIFIIELANNRFLRTDHISAEPPVQQSNEAPPSPIGFLHSENGHSGCGCSIHPLSAGGNYESKKRLVSTDYGQTAWMNVNGSDITLLSGQSTQKPAAKYRSGDITLNIQSVPLKRQSCVRGAGECEVIELEFQMQLKVGSSEPVSFRGAGICGC